MNSSPRRAATGHQGSSSIAPIICPDGLRCPRNHVLDIDNVMRNSIQQIHLDGVTDDEIRLVQAAREGPKGTSSEAELVWKAFKATSRGNHSERNERAAKVVKLYHRFQDQNFCLFVLAQAIRKYQINRHSAFKRGMTAPNSFSCPSNTSLQPPTPNTPSSSVPDIVIPCYTQEPLEISEDISFLPSRVIGAFHASPVHKYLQGGTEPILDGNNSSNDEGTDVEIKNYYSIDIQLWIKLFWELFSGMNGLLQRIKVTLGALSPFGLGQWTPQRPEDPRRQRTLQVSPWWLWRPRRG